ncbi:MAG: single-stranded-DNA-specific exonuclease RecJ [Acidobacteria bacterium]|nr:single-stranded-DNA-specific exonuclease RecJ [Acidobacteriota bacterium]
MARKIWDEVPSDADGASRLAAALGLPPVLARLLHQRGLTDPDEAQRFLDPSLAHLHDPFLLTDMRPAVARLHQAIERRERVMIHGDYDADGITSTAMLQRALEMLGADVGHFVPDRMKDGYGLQPKTIEHLASLGARLIVSVDCGIRASEAARRARDLGVDLIITDHHEPEAELPQAVAVINPKRPDCAYPEKFLAGAGVALKLVQALLQDHAAGAGALSSFIKMAAIGTMADVVPLVGENRVIAKFGLDALSRGPHGTGLEALLEESGLSGKRLDSFHVGFVLAPRLNAAGRMGHAGRAVDLLLSRGRDAESRVAARALAKELTDENTRRQESEAGMLVEARRMVEKDPEIGGHNMLVVASEGWHRGVVGIVASKLVDSFCKPAIVLAIENGVAHGSCRSIPAFDMLAALEANPDVFMKFGGHKQAAGVTVDVGRLPEMRRRLTEYANLNLEPADLIPRLRIDAPLGLRDITGDVVQALSRLEPFGSANPKPIFRASPVELAQPPRVMKERHLSLMFRQDGRSFRGVAWRAAEREAYLSANRFGLELAYSLDQNDFRGERVTELTVADVRAPEGETAA